MFEILLGINKLGQVWHYMVERKKKEKEMKKSSPKPPGGLNEITSQKIELAWPTEGRNTRN